MHIYVGGKKYLDKNMQDPGRSYHFTPWFFKVNVFISFLCTFTFSSANMEREEETNVNLHFEKYTIFDKIRFRFLVL